MDNKFRLRGVMPGDLEYIAAHMRHDDRHEIQAAFWDGVDVLTVLKDSARLSRDLLVVGEIQGEPAALAGLARTATVTGWSRIGAPWLLGTDRITENPKAFLAVCRPVLDEMLRLSPHLVNYSDARATRTHRWLRQLGFTLTGPEPYGMQGLPFYKLEIKPDV